MLKSSYILLTLLLATNASAVEVPREVRDDAFRRAQIWRQPEIPISHANLAITPLGEDGFAATDTVRCKFENKKPNGLTPKFFCTLPDGKSIKVKPQILGSEARMETAGSRLLNVLGFGADRMYLVQGVKCKGCPRFTYTRGWGVTSKFRLPFTTIHFKNAAIERKFDGVEIDTAEGEGWAFYELAKIEPSLGGAPKAHVDALRLLAMFLGHWDNKSENQRLVCLNQEFKANPSHCEDPFLIMQDIGATFGPERYDVEKWARTPIWADSITCKVSMKGWPFDGATFEDSYISEPGRQFLASLLKQLTHGQIVDLFTGAHFGAHKDPKKQARNLSRWVEAFGRRVNQIVEHPGCPQN